MSSLETTHPEFVSGWYIGPSPWHQNSRLPEGKEVFGITTLLCSGLDRQIATSPGNGGGALSPQTPANTSQGHPCT